VTVQATHKMTALRTIGHTALYYRPGSEAAARRLFTDIGCTLVDNGPDPGSDGFCSALIDGDTATHADNIVFLSKMSAEQAALEEAITTALGLGSDAADPAFAGLEDKLASSPEVGSHIGIRFASFEALEDALAAVEHDAAPGGVLEGHVRLTKYRARPGLDAGVDARMAASPAFGGGERPAFADHWVQCFVRTDLFGLLTSARTIELDYVFDPFFGQVPSFGTPRAR